MNTFVTVYSKQIGGPLQYVLVQTEKEPKWISPVLYYWLKFHGKEALVTNYVQVFDKEQCSIVHEETEAQGEKVIHHTYGKYFRHFTFTEERVSHLPELTQFLETFHSDTLTRKEMTEKIGSSLEQISFQKNKQYMDGVAELVQIYKKFLAR